MQTKVSFGTKKVQKMGRIALTEELLRNAELQEGDPVEIYFDVKTRAIIIERAAGADVIGRPNRGRRGEGKSG